MNRMNNRVRLPAEWENHEATILCWPHNREDWPGKFEPIPWVYAEIVRNIVPGEAVHILVQSKIHQASVEKILLQANVPLENIFFIVLKTDRGWLRDTSPLFVKNARVIKAVNFQFNGWAKYDDWKNDKNIPDAVCKKLSLGCINVKLASRQVVLEGGSIDCNGEGTLLTTEECLLDSHIQVRNHNFTKEDYENVFNEYLGIKKVVWLGKGIIGDDTHGHVDDIARFVNKNTIVICREENSKDENYQSLNENFERLQNEKRADGLNFKVITLPMPSPVVFENQRLPASYANFYISNNAVLVPTFNDSNDHLAINILSGLFPERKVIGIHAVDLVWGLGTIHCLTHEVPA